MLADLVARQRAGGLRGIAGAAIKTRLPLREGFLNQCLQQDLADWSVGGVTANRISIRDNNIVVANVTVRKWMFTRTLDLALEIDPIIDFPRDPFLRLRLMGGGLLAVVAELFAKLPNYVTFASRTCTVDLRSALALAGAAEAVPLVQYIGVTTTAGLLHLDIRLAVPADIPPVRMP